MNFSSFVRLRHKICNYRYSVRSINGAVQEHIFVRNLRVSIVILLLHHISISIADDYFMKRTSIRLFLLF